MRLFIYISLFIFIASTHLLKAQSFSGSMPPAKNYLSAPGDHKLFFTSTGFAFIPKTTFPHPCDVTIKSEVPKLAFFCNMENKFRNRFNVYLKLRAGNDDMYRSLIREQGK